MLNVYYDRLNSRVIREIPDYTLVQLFSDFGGVLGVILGTSVITFIEFLYFLVDLILHVITKGRISIIQ